ncbi:P-loop containing nucleoside triphosphate hydrolase protein [Hygrophoropsis aurantiaca]|uniref:P-loop containing nucleoside triphosphate hydrolase protein n=1 Tax=Hygrophoropsis aurantiaca TaxID=72124 RepID=A0ACB8AKV6_9AGAM|nr:P-loop containing nucleoside triphosphate hydrolase protein [Hygrophoropsis aurantiaca]
MQSRSQTLEITTRVGNKDTTVKGRAKKVEGRGSKIAVEGSVKGKTIVSIATIGKEEPTAAEAQRETLVLWALQKKVTLSSQPFFQSIWLPAEKPYWPPFPAHSLATIYSPEQPLNASQELAVQKILSTHQNDRIVVIRGPPGTGKTSVIAASVTSLMNSNDPKRTIWIAAQSNVAVKNIAEKLARVGFLDFKLLVSKDFHFDWHEHLYEQLSQRVIRSDSFSDDIVGASRLILGSRVMLCTLSMLSNSKLDVFTRLVPVSMVIFDEASQIEVGDYIPMLHRFQTTLRKVVFIGDDKQLAPYGQDDIGDLRSIFEFSHIRRRVCFLDTQYRMPVIIVSKPVDLSMYRMGKSRRQVTAGRTEKNLQSSFTSRVHIIYRGNNSASSLHMTHSEV